MSLYDRLASPGSLWFESTCPDECYGDSLFFSDPVETLPLAYGDDITAWFAQLESWLERGFCLAGWLGYEAGFSLDPALSGCAWPPGSQGLSGWFGVYAKPERFDRAIVGAEDERVSAKPHRIARLRFELTEKEYLDRLALLKEEIASGNVYQVNFTGRCRFTFDGSPEALYVAMKRRQPSPWSAYLNTGERVILSFSPELFFSRQGLGIETMPMKGTAPRGTSPERDRAERQQLSLCEKNRAENLMIVDLLRNDLGRICRTGSIEASSLFETQTYPTLHQMVSTVRGELRENIGLHGLFRALFPSGSVTGAPKVNAMNLIRSLEKSPRGVYTGAVGFMLPGGRMAFNVAIRTIELSGGTGVYGTGSGIVWDSDPQQEYRECMLKARILSDLADELPGLFETILWNGGYLLIEDHVERLASSASALGIECDVGEVRAALAAADRELSVIGGRHRVRLSLDPGGNLSVFAEPFIPEPLSSSVRVCIATERVDSADPLIHHKVTWRERYDRGLRAALDNGFQETLFLNERGEVTEGAISNVIARIDGTWYTPPESCGLLNGVYRRYLLRTRPWIRERVITLDDLHRADLLLICNALRGVRRAGLPDAFGILKG
ncbi:MAG: aminodeoxychorismate synthase component I [Chlorobiaceae bacterium]|nr:aminodeoxychorismate synthase component I [Chlorobiaceae bacterium]